MENSGGKRARRRGKKNDQRKRLLKKGRYLEKIRGREEKVLNKKAEGDKEKVKEG